MNRSAKDDDAARVEQDHSVIRLGDMLEISAHSHQLVRSSRDRPDAGCSVQSLFSWIHDAVIIADGRPQLLKDDETFAFLNGRGPNI